MPSCILTCLLTDLSLAPVVELPFITSDAVGEKLVSLAVRHTAAEARNLLTALLCQKDHWPPLVLSYVTLGAGEM